mmetsp:Transcript_3914/g.6158  ORF Transcript_3914/g.6158 Transcript_3914/m.6158 type:complete len:163 (+) Transcript_3914:29-517(+)|eukprot:CAMPEP_0174953952 /NCGR_PEP_ID=MMETSP0004_2-20121128/155_1 /TAXON_ID=420556 /ORGANISM="Ochromonas sp., Strain CCMP1393" /LENGTH=162 /DNA_ID=CAMNT_0016201713 /DNA_START=34 /DNA_END=522 /DNA_ORIENTATION=-
MKRNGDNGTSEGIKITEDGGILKKVLKEGVGEEIPAGKVAVVHYTGKLLNGKVFDSSKNRGKPFQFTVGKREVILGWDKGVKTMRKGEVCILTCQPDYAYGSRAIGPIPANSTLLFEVELLDWLDKPEGGGISDLIRAAMVILLFLAAGTMLQRYLSQKQSS